MEGRHWEGRFEEEIGRGDLAQLLAAMRVVTALFGFIFRHNLFQESR